MLKSDEVDVPTTEIVVRGCLKNKSCNVTIVFQWQARLHKIK